MVNTIKKLISEMEETVEDLKGLIAANDIKIFELETSNEIFSGELAVYEEKISKLEDRLLELEK